MKKTGILNAQLLCELTKLRHKDKLVICDAGFPLPAEANVVDISLVAGLPNFLQTLQAVVNELIFEEYVVFDVMAEKNPAYYQVLQNLFREQAHREVSMDAFRELSADAKLFIRTGELKPASNLLLVSASGTQPAVERFNVHMD